MKFWNKYSPYIITISSILIVFVLSYIEVRSNIQFWYGFSTSNILSSLAVVGVFGTLLGLFLTYRQVKLAEDRIDGYDQLYDAIFELLDDKKGDKIQFYGSTLIPGHFTYASKNKMKSVENFRLKIENKVSTSELEPTSKQFILPAFNMYQETYKGYEKKSSKEFVSKLVDEVKKMHKRIEIDSLITSVPDKNKIEDMLDSFYISNGRTAIFAKPLHYDIIKTENNNTSDSEKNHLDFEPILIGFKTRDRSIIKGFEKHFDKLILKINNGAQS